MLVVTHDPEEAMTIADDLILMADGRILQTGTPEDCYDNPVSSVAARLLGEAILLHVQVANGIADTPFGPVLAPGLAHGPATMMLRPSDLRVSLQGAPASVVSERRFGSETVATVTFAGKEFAIRTSGAELSAGEGIHLDADRKALRFFAADSV